MKLFFAAVFLSAMTAFASTYKPPVLDKGSQHTYQTYEAQMVSQAAIEAFNNNKKLLLKVSAAWCGPCAILDQSLKRNPQYKQDILANFVWAEVDDELLENLSNLSDFMPFEPLYYPSIYLYDPVTGKWAMTGAGSAKGLKENLDVYLKDGGFAEKNYIRINELINAGTSAFDNNNEGVGLLMDAALGMAIEEPTSGKVQGLIAKVLLNKNLFIAPGETEIDGNVLWGIESALSVLVERGVLDGTAARVLIPEAYDGYNENYYLIDKYEFYAVIGNALRTQGNTVAVSQCRSLAEKIAKASQPAAGSALEGWWNQNLQTKRMVCAILESQAGQVDSTFVQSIVDAIENDPDLEDVMDRSLGRLLANAGEFTKAIVYNDRYAADRAESYQDSLDIIEDELADAIAQGDKDAIRQLEFRKRIVTLLKDRMANALNARSEAYRKNKVRP